LSAQAGIQATIWRLSKRAYKLDPGFRRGDRDYLTGIWGLVWIIHEHLDNSTAVAPDRVFMN